MTYIVSQDTATVFYNGDYHQVFYMPPANVASGATDTSLITAVSGRKIVVVSLVVVVGNVATNVTFGSKLGAAASTALSGLLQFGANGGIALPTDGFGHYQANIGEAFVATTSASGVTTAINGKYILV